MPLSRTQQAGDTKAAARNDGHRVRKPLSKPRASTKSDRLKVMQDTIRRTPSIIDSIPGVSATSTFYDRQLQPLDRNECPDLELRATKFLLGDTFAVTRRIMDDNTSHNSNDQQSADKVAVLNMASDVKVAGASGIPSGPTQEDALYLSSTLYATLKNQSSNYPWKKSMAAHERNTNHCAAIYSPYAVIFKDSSAKGYEELAESQRRVVGVISVAAPRGLKASNDDTESTLAVKTQELREKIRMIARIAACNKKPVLVLGAMGCGKFNCDPELVASTFRIVLMEDEFAGWFEQFVFAIYTQSTLGIFEQAWSSQGQKDLPSQLPQLD